MNRIFTFHDNWTNVFLYHQLLLVAALFLNTVMLIRPVFAQLSEDAENEQKLKGKNTSPKVTLETLTIDKAIELALDRSRELQSLNTNVQIANYRLDSSGRINNPELRIYDVSTKYYTDEFDELRVGVRWRPPKIGELAEEKQQAQVRLWTRKVRTLRFRQQLVAKVRRNYANVIMYDRLAELAQKRVSLETERIGIIDQMVALGRRSVVYQTKARMWHVKSKNDCSRIIQKQRSARQKLAEITGVSEDINLTIEDLPEVSQDLNQLITIAFENRPEIELVRQQKELAVKQYEFEHRKAIPWPTFIDLSYHVENGRREDWGELRAGIDLPIFNWNRGNIRATELAVKRKEGESDAIREEIEGEVRAAYSTYIEYLLDWRNFSRDAEELIAHAQTLIKQAEKHETLEPDEVLEMELTVIETQELLSEKRCGLAHTLIDLCFALGIEGWEKLSQEKER